MPSPLIRRPSFDSMATPTTLQRPHHPPQQEGEEFKESGEKKEKALSQPEVPTKNAILKQKRVRALFEMDKEHEKPTIEEYITADDAETEDELTGMLLMQPKPIRMHVLEMLLG